MRSLPPCLATILLSHAVQELTLLLPQADNGYVRLLCCTGTCGVLTFCEQTWCSSASPMVPAGLESSDEEEAAGAEPASEDDQPHATAGPLSSPGTAVPGGGRLKKRAQDVLDEDVGEADHGLEDIEEDIEIATPQPEPEGEGADDQPVERQRKRARMAIFDESDQDE